MHRLKDGQDLRDSFSVALMRSSLVVPIVSLNAINKIKRVPTCVDNVLVEWLLVAILFSPGMAELNPEMRVKRVLPVIIDKNLLDTIRNLPDLDIHPSATYEVVCRIIRDCQLTVPPTVWDRFPHTMTIKSIVLGLLDRPIWADLSNASVPPSLIQHVAVKVKETLDQILSTPATIPIPIPAPIHPTIPSPTLNPPPGPTFTTLPPTPLPSPSSPITTTITPPTLPPTMSTIDLPKAWAILKDPRMHLDETGSAVSALLNGIGMYDYEESDMQDLKVDTDALSDLVPLLKKAPLKKFRAAMGM